MVQNLESSESTELRGLLAKKEAAEGNGGFGGEGRGARGWLRALHWR